jgi:hypothetical protein
MMIAIFIYFFALLLSPMFIFFFAMSEITAFSASLSLRHCRQLSLSRQPTAPAEPSFRRQLRHYASQPDSLRRDIAP